MLEITNKLADWLKNHQSPVTITMFVKFLNTVTCTKDHETHVHHSDYSVIENNNTPTS